MQVLIVGAAGKTGRHVIAALQARPDCPTIRGHGRKPIALQGIEALQGDLDSAADRALAVAGMDAVIHYGPAMDGRETAIGTGMIDAARAAGVRRFIYVSVIHPQIDDLVNHRAKLAVEAHLLDSGLDWTILRPQHYMQNIDVPGALTTGHITMPYPARTVLGHVDMVDLAAAAAKVLLEPGHSYATYDIAADEHLSVEEICAAVTRIGGRPVEARATTPEDLVAAIARHHPLPPYSVEAFHRLFGYYARRGIRGNGNVLGWLLGRAPTSFDAYVQRSLDREADAVRRPSATTR